MFFGHTKQPIDHLVALINRAVEADNGSVGRPFPAFAAAVPTRKAVTPSRIVAIAALLHAGPGVCLPGKEPEPTSRTA
jgi:hypothetical protein